MRHLRSWLVFLLLGLVAGCSSPFNTFNPAGPEARSLASLGWWLSLFMLIVIVVMSVLVVWAALRRNGSLYEHMPVDSGGGKQWILIGGLLFSGTVLTILFLITLWTLNPLASKAQAVDLEIEVTAHRWWWEVNYPGDNENKGFETANEIHIPTNAKIGIKLLSADVIHSFWVPRLHGKLDMIPGKENYLILEADKPGTYRGQCAEYCGMQHSHMRFRVIAHSPEEYQRWVAAQREPAVKPDTAKLTQGKKIFESYACASCHTVRGTPARGSVGPDLTHFGSREMLGAGILPNKRANLQAWIVDAQAIKPGINMPTLKQFDGEQLNALAAYLESLE